MYRMCCVQPPLSFMQRGNMLYLYFRALIISVVIVDSFGLNCRSDGGPKEDELKKVYMNCLRRQDGRNSSDNRGYSSDQDWRDPKRKNQNHWDKRDDHMGSREDRVNSRDHNHGRDEEGGYDMMRRNDRMGGSHDRTGSRDRIESSGRNNGRNYQMDGRNDRMGSRDDRMSGQSDRSGREDRNSRDEWMGHDDRYGRDDMINGREDFPQSHEYDSESRFTPYRSSQNSQRYRRERQSGKNSGSRSQYNPYSSRSGHEGNDDRNSSENNSSKDNESKGCVLHCFLEELEMTGDNGMPDRYLVTHAITKDVKNEDLKDFLQESIEECFQILYNENTEDKCDFSKNLMLCLSEKGRANCDDWKDGVKTIRYS